MRKGEAMANSNHFDLKKLKEEYMIANRELSGLNLRPSSGN